MGKGVLAMVKGGCNGKKSWNWSWVPALSLTGHMTSDKSPDLCELGLDIDSTMNCLFDLNLFTSLL